MRKNAAVREQARLRELELLKNEAAQAAILRAETERLQAQLAAAEARIRSEEEKGNNIITYQPHALIFEK